MQNMYFLNVAYLSPSLPLLLFLGFKIIYLDQHDAWLSIWKTVGDPSLKSSKGNMSS
jgi:hypothetical protein